MRRLQTGGRIRRDRPLLMQFDGKNISGFEGDTLSSALLANGVDLVARSFKYHRPRGIFAAGREEPNALVHLGQAARHEPNVQTSTVAAFDGAIARSQNAWPTLSHDIGAINGLLSPFLGAGFYYKTFIGPFRGTRFWMLCESFIRRAAGMGQGSYLPDPDLYEKRHAHCDLLVIGAGAAGLVAALTAAEAGASVILVEQDRDLGGELLSCAVDSKQDTWRADLAARVIGHENIELLTQTCCFGAYDGDTYGAIERIADHVNTAQPARLRQRYWQIHAQRAIAATGAIERPLIFGNNDLPGVMLAGALGCYLNRYAILAGSKIVLATNNDSVYQTAVDLAQAGAQVSLADMRKEVSASLCETLAQAGITHFLGHGILRAKGRRALRSVLLVPVDTQGQATGPAQEIAADRLGVSGGFTPVLHLWSHRYGKPEYTQKGDCFLAPERGNDNLRMAGIAAGTSCFHALVEDAKQKATEAALACGYRAESPLELAVPAEVQFWQGTHHPVAIIRDGTGKCAGKAFVDFQHDVKLSDIDQAYREGYVSVEHLKRYTTLGMATDQGKLSNMTGLAHLATLAGKQIGDVGTTTFRPPYAPVSIGALVGHEHGLHFRPTRQSPIHDWHVENGAEMTTAGAWMRPWYYPQGQAGLTESYIQEADHVRCHVGMVDVSTLGKIAVQGPDAAELLDRVYVNGWRTLRPGRIRYGVMLREDGLLMDDGATACLSEGEYFMTTTTANAAKVLAKLEHLLQTAWRDLRVHVTSVTDQWAAIALAGPNARALLGGIVKDADLSAAALPNNHWVGAKINRIPVRVHRMSYSGELAYEIYAPFHQGRKIWEALAAAGQSFDLRPYGTEAMGALRIEKGHIAGPELDGRTTLQDVGMSGFASTKKPFVGSVLKDRPNLVSDDRPVLVGLDFGAQKGAKPGALLFHEDDATTGHGQGWVSSTTYSPALGKYIGLAFCRNGQNILGIRMRVIDRLGNYEASAKLVPHHFFDPKGERQNA